MRARGRLSTPRWAPERIDVASGIATLETAITLLTALILLVVAWIVLVVGIRFVVAPRLATLCAGDPIVGLARVLVLGYCRIVHRIRVEGVESIPNDPSPGPLLVVANHTAGIDPLLIQSQCRFLVRWMMAEEMMSDALDELWRWIGVIPVRRDTRDSAALRTALRHLQNGGVVGVFPEGGITRPTGQIAPFLAGVGLLASRTGASVLLIAIDGTPTAPTAFGSLIRPSHSVLRCSRIEPYPRSAAAEAIAEDLRQRLAALSGWPLAASRLGREIAPDAKFASGPGTSPEPR